MRRYWYGLCQSRRGEIIDYVVNQYGRANVAQIITFGKLLAKVVIRDVARVLICLMQKMLWQNWFLMN